MFGGETDRCRGWEIGGGGEMGPFANGPRCARRLALSVARRIVIVSTVVWRGGVVSARQQQRCWWARVGVMREGDAAEWGGE